MNAVYVIRVLKHYLNHTVHPYKIYFYVLCYQLLEFNLIFMDGCIAISTVNWPSLHFYQINLYDYMCKMCFFGNNWRHPTNMLVIWSTEYDCDIMQ